MALWFLFSFLSLSFAIYLVLSLYSLYYLYITILLICFFCSLCLFSYLSPRSLLLCLHFPLSITVFLLSAVLFSPIWQPCEQGRKLRRIHWVANVGRALKFLEGRRVRKSIPRVLCSGVQLQVITTQSDLHNLFPALLCYCSLALQHCLMKDKEKETPVLHFRFNSYSNWEIVSFKSPTNDGVMDKLEHATWLRIDLWGDVDTSDWNHSPY